MILKLFLFFLKLGVVSFGGGYPLITFIMSEGEKAVGLTSSEFADMMALELLASGPIAINSATYVGYIKGGILGAIVATIGVILPGTILSLLLYEILKRYQHNRYIRGFMDSIKMACGGLVLAAAIKLANNILILTDTIQEVFQAPLAAIQWGGVLIVAISFLCLRLYKMNPVTVIGIAAVAGAFLL